ncbi:MAG: excinuclease ABC subunit A [Bacteroidaceae bacterium]|nr:excinuclease ABC subunit A [Bacteroidaceae bacterium]
MNSNLNIASQTHTLPSHNGVAGEESSIHIEKARVNNLKDVTVDIPREKLVVVTGLSGSGKSSLAFDTLYAEGQRRYVESLNAYARQFLGRMSKPECDYISGIPPAIAIEQKVISRNPRSTVGTSTEIYEYLRLLYARIGRTYSPISGQEVKKHTTEDVVQTVLSYSPGTRFLVLCPIRITEGRTLEQQLKAYLQEGYTRLVAGQLSSSSPHALSEMEGADSNGIWRIEDFLNHLSADPSPTLPAASLQPTIYLLIDRLSVPDYSPSGKAGSSVGEGVNPSLLSRLIDSAETAFYEGGGEMMLKFLPAGIEHVFSTRFEADGITFEEPSDQLFAFNSPMGACPTCQGWGNVQGIDPHLVIPDSSKSVYDGCVQCWRGDKLGEWRMEFIRQAERTGFPIFKPYFELTKEEKNVLWHGTAHPQALPRDGYRMQTGMRVCIDAFFDELKEARYKIQNRVMLARYTGKTECPDCHGTRLRKEATYVKVAGKAITELVDMSIEELMKWVKSLSSPTGEALTPHEYKIAQRLLVEIESRLQFLLDVGLGYLTLGRRSNSLSGGESQRINLATSLGSSLVGSLYILDEPSIGLHSRDTARLIHVLRQLVDLGNTVVVVEHDEDIIRAADYFIDMGPEAGRLGGEVVWRGQKDLTQDSRTLAQTNPKEASKDLSSLGFPKETIQRSHTLQWLLGLDTIGDGNHSLPHSRRPWNRYIEVKGARANNLRGIDVKFPLNVMTCVTGVSGSGKSTLVRDILYNALKRHLDETADRPGEHIGLEGDLNAIQAVEFVDQNPIGKSSRSNPVIYVKAYDEIRRLFADQPLSKQMGFTASHFSFNTEGGRCEECKGEGTVTIEMQFMADLVLECESCHGQRFKSDILDVRYHGQNINDVLNMTVNQAMEFFAEHGEKKIVRRLKPLQDVGLGYIKLGQSSSTLSGGENQRVKLAYYIGTEKQSPTLFIFDEPTTGLHFHDIRRLLSSLDALIERGHTILIIEHNMDVIKMADYIIDLGPEGGAAGGNLVVAGTPEEVAACKQSYTGRFLKEKLL